MTYAISMYFDQWKDNKNNYLIDYGSDNCVKSTHSSDS